MAEPPEPRRPSPSAGATSRRERLAEAMRENLKRRKAQQRLRDAVDPQQSEPVEEA